jgi:uncharacterized protein YjdB
MHVTDEVSVPRKGNIATVISYSLVVLFSANGYLMAQTGYRVLHIGNSYTVGCHFEPEYFAGKAGFTNHFHRCSWNPGITLDGLWNSPRHSDSEGDHLCGWTYALDNLVWDRFIIQPYYENLASCITAANNFYDYALSHKSPNIQMVVFQIWPHKAAADWSSDRQPNTIKYYEDLATAMQNAHPGKPPVIISPVGMVIIELRRLTRLEQVPGVSSEAAWYADEGHLSDLGNYAAGLTHFVTLYKVDPRKYAIPAQAGESGWWWGYTINSQTADKIKEVVWTVVSGYARSGVGAGSTDNIPPEKPANVTASTVTSSGLTLSWTASTDNTGIAGYEVMNGAVSVGSTSSTSLAVTSLKPATTYSFTVKARDMAGNISVSDPCMVTTASATVSVTGVTLDSSRITLNIRVGKKLIPTVLPTEASNKGVTWSCAAPSIVFVAADGTVTGVGAGTTSVTVHTNDGNRTATCQVTVLANRAPVAAFTFATGTVPLQVSFDGTASTDPDTGDGIFGFDWDFGDGSPRTMSDKPVHVYAVAGTYTVTLVVLDNNKTKSAPLSKTVNVSTAALAGRSPRGLDRREAIESTGYVFYDVCGREVRRAGVARGQTKGPGTGIYLVRSGSSTRVEIIKGMLHW